MKKAAAQLKTYRAKRDFTKTKEPSGSRAVLPAEHRRFVIQKHAASHLHWDFRLELNGVFKSWAVTKGPSVDPADKRLAVEVEDHPLDYGDFEGTIPKGEYGGGTVQMWDRGFWAPQGPEGPRRQSRQADFKFVLAGERLKGSWVLVRIRNNRGRDTRTNWLLIKHKDEYAVPGGTEALIAEDRSVASGRSMEQIARRCRQGAPPVHVSQSERRGRGVAFESHGGRSPRHVPRLVPSVREAARLKVHAGVHRTSAVQNWSNGRRRARNGRTRSSSMATACNFACRTARPASALAPGSIGLSSLPPSPMPPKHCPIAYSMAKSVQWTRTTCRSFAALQAALSEERSEGLVFFAFDLLFEGKEDCRELPLTTRKARLKALLEEAGADATFRYVEHFEFDRQ